MKTTSRGVYDKKRQFTMTSDFATCVTESWNSFSDQNVQGPLRSMPKRCLSVI